MVRLTSIFSWSWATPRREKL